MSQHNLFERLLMHLIFYYVSAVILSIIAICKVAKILILALIRIGIGIPSQLLYGELPYGEREHAENLAKVQRQVKEWNASGRKTKMCTGRPGWRTVCNRTPIYKDTMTRINIDMNKLVYIKTDENMNRNVVCVEPLLTIGELGFALDKLGWGLKVVPELEVLTIGGLICGAGLETSSHKYGLFHNTCVAFEFVLSSGEVVKCTEKENSDLFYAIPGSHGTLGFLTAVEIEIVQVKTHVKLEYIPVHSLDEAVSTFEAQTYRKHGNEFVEGIMYSLEKGVIMVGDMVSDPPYGMVNQIGKWYKPWFYKHVEKFLYMTSWNTNEKFIEYIPLREYYHRHTKCLFWVNANFFPYGNNVIFRYFFGWVLPPRIDLVKLLSPKKLVKMFDKNHLTQDFVIPLEKLKEGLVMCHNVTKVYPIWLCPTKFINSPGACHFLGDGDEMYADIGIYGISPLKEYDMIKSARKMEEFCLKNRGYQALYSDVFLTRDEFGKMFKDELYRKMRKQLNCEDAFPEVYEKVCRAARQ